MNVRKWKGINYNVEKISSVHKGCKICVCLPVGRNWITFDRNNVSCLNFHIQYTAEVVALGWCLNPIGPPPGPWSGKNPFPRILSSLWVFCYWLWNTIFEPCNMPNNNLGPNFMILSLNLKYWGDQIAVDKGSSKNSRI